MPYSTRYPDLTLKLQWTSFQKAQLPSSKISLPPDSTEILYVYGLTANEALLKWVDADPERLLIFLEDDLGAFETFSSRPEAPSYIDHPQIHLKHIPPGITDAVLEACAIEFPREKIEVVSAKPSSRFRTLRLSLLRKTLLKYSVASEEISSHLLHRNIIQNLRRIPLCSYVNRWKDAFKDVPLVICGAGPSLQKVAGELKNIRSHALIIGCGSGLSALSHLGIRPHLGIAFDPNDREFDCLKGCSYRDLPLLFGTRLLPKVFELFEGPYGYIRSGTGGRLESYVEEVLGMNDSYVGLDLGHEALSVTTLALSLGHYLGCNPIIFAGVDLAFDGRKHYAEGVQAPAQLDQLIRRKGCEGWVQTNVKWVMEKDTLDQYAKNHPETQFWKASPGGLGFEHIPFRSFQEMIFTESIDLDAKAQSLMKQTRMTATTLQIEEVLTSLQMSFERSLEILVNLQQELSPGKQALYQSELESELAYEIILKSAHQTLERVGQTPVPHLIEMTKGYLTSLRPAFSRVT